MIGKGKKMIYGYIFKVMVEKEEEGYVAIAPGVGGIYCEGKTREEAIENAYNEAIAVLQIRLEKGYILENNDFLKALKAPPTPSYICRFKNMSDGLIFTQRPAHCINA